MASNGQSNERVCEIPNLAVPTTGTQLVGSLPLGGNLSNGSNFVNFVGNALPGGNLATGTPVVSSIGDVPSVWNLGIGGNGVMNGNVPIVLGSDQPFLQVPVVQNLTTTGNPFQWLETLAASEKLLSGNTGGPLRLHVPVSGNVTTGASELSGDVPVKFEGIDLQSVGRVLTGTDSTTGGTGQQLNLHFSSTQKMGFGTQSVPSFLQVLLDQKPSVGGNSVQTVTNVVANEKLLQQGNTMPPTENVSANQQMASNSMSVQPPRGEGNLSMKGENGAQSMAQQLKVTIPEEPVNLSKPGSEEEIDVENDDDVENRSNTERKKKASKRSSSTNKNAKKRAARAINYDVLSRCKDEDLVNLVATANVLDKNNFEVIKHYFHGNEGLPEPGKNNYDFPVRKEITEKKEGGKIFLNETTTMLTINFSDRKWRCYFLNTPVGKDAVCEIPDRSNFILLAKPASGCSAVLDLKINSNDKIGERTPSESSSPSFSVQSVLNLPSTSAQKEVQSTPLQQTATQSSSSTVNTHNSEKLPYFAQNADFLNCQATSVTFSQNPLNLLHSNQSTSKSNTASLVALMTASWNSLIILMTKAQQSRNIILEQKMAFSSSVKQVNSVVDILSTPSLESTSSNHSQTYVSNTPFLSTSNPPLSRSRALFDRNIPSSSTDFDPNQPSTSSGSTSSSKNQDPDPFLKPELPARRKMLHDRKLHQKNLYKPYATPPKFFWPDILHFNAEVAEILRRYDDRAEATQAFIASGQLYPVSDSLRQMYPLLDIPTITVTPASDQNVVAAQMLSQLLRNQITMDYERRIRTTAHTFYIQQEILRIYFQTQLRASCLDNVIPPFVNNTLNSSITPVISIAPSVLSQIFFDLNDVQPPAEVRSRVDGEVTLRLNSATFEMMKQYLNTQITPTFQFWRVDGNSENASGRFPGPDI